MSRLLLVTACKTALLSGKPVLQPLRAALTGLQQLCTWAAEPLEETKVDSQTTYSAVEAPSQRNSTQVFGNSAAGGPAVKRGMILKQNQCKQGGRTAAYIGAQKDKLMQSVRGPQPDPAMDSFYRGMSALCSRPESCINYMHLNAVIGATAKAWTTARGRFAQQKQKHAHHQMHAFLTKMFRTLQPLLPDVEVRQAANMLWSSAQLGLNPDALVPGMTDSLARRFMVDMNAANGQSFANVLVACAKLQLSPCRGVLCKTILNRLATADLSNFEPQPVANILHSLATIPAAAPSIEVLDALCQHFDVLLKSRQAVELPNEQSIASTMWALSKLKHAPSDELAMTMVGRMVALCRVPGQQPTPQAISNVLLACAQLSLPVKQADIDSLASFLLSLDRQQVRKQEYANTAWSLAVLGYLREAQLELLLDELSALLVNHRELSQSSLLIQLTQLYQALDWLQPPQNADTQQAKAWLNLKGKLSSLGPRPAAEPHPEAQLVCSALTQLSLRFKATPAISGYRTAAVLEPIGSGAPIVVSFESNHHLINKESRLMGRIGFRQRLLSRKGKLVQLTPPRAGAAVQEVADYLKPILTTAAGGSLDAYRICCSSPAAGK